MRAPHSEVESECWDFKKRWIVGWRVWSRNMNKSEPPGQARKTFDHDERYGRLRHEGVGGLDS